MVLSFEPLSNICPLGEKQIETTLLVCPTKYLRSFPVEESHNIKQLLYLEQLKITLLSGEKQSLITER